MPPSRLEGQARGLLRRQRASWAALRGRAFPGRPLQEPRKRFAGDRDRPQESREGNGSGRRGERPREPAACPRLPRRSAPQAGGRAVPAGGRARHHGDAHRRTSRRARRNLEHADQRPRARSGDADVHVRPLEGITVVALEQVIAGPLATRQLADLGARVIKIERPGEGDASRGYDRTVKGLSSHFVWVNRSKESLALDVKRPEAAEVLARLVARADVFLQNLAPGAADRLGLGPSLRSRHPRLIWCGVSGYGPAGPYASKKAYDLLVQCEAGLLSVTGTPDAPSKAGIPAADIAAGMYAFSSILAALLRRERTGEGATLDITM
ncbi:MAG: CoA transferase, partial [Betaproteobacteria bacterium]|nr:CoA transferase [Betaproteobacteria bacterium]